MILNTQTGVNLYSKKVPVLEEAHEFATAGIVPGGTENNLDFVRNEVRWPDNVSRTERLILCDAQTSGGLLIAVAKRDVDGMMEKMQKAGIEAAVIGEFGEEQKGRIVVL